MWLGNMISVYMYKLKTFSLLTPGFQPYVTSKLITNEYSHPDPTPVLWKEECYIPSVSHHSLYDK